MDTKPRPRMHSARAVLLSIALAGSSVPFVTVLLLTGTAMPGLAIMPVPVLVLTAVALLLRGKFAR